VEKTPLDSIWHRSFGAGLLLILFAADIGHWRSYLLGNKVPIIRSIAVATTREPSHDPEQEYFVDGMTDALTTSLSKVGGATR